MHNSVQSMRTRAFTKGRSAFDSDDEYRRALNGEFDGVREDFSYEANEDPDDGEGDGGPEGPSNDEAVRAELKRFEKRIGRTHFLEVLERFMKACSGDEEPPYLPFGPMRNIEHLAVFDAGAEALRLRYGVYGLEADRLEGDEVVKTWKGLDEVDVLDDDDWDDALEELAEEAEEAGLGKEDLEDGRKDEFFDDVLPGILADRKRGAEFLDFIVGGNGAAEPPLLTPLQKAATEVRHFQVSEQLWLVHDRSGFRLERLDKARQAQVPVQVPATWDEEEFLEKLREVAWDDPECRDHVLDGELGEAWSALDDAWYYEDEGGFVADSVKKFLADVEGAKKDLWTGLVKRDVAVCEEADTGRVEMKMVWDRTYPDTAELTLLRDGEEEMLCEVVPLAFLRWWKFCRERDW